MACSCGGGPSCRNPFGLATWGKITSLTAGGGEQEFARIVLPQGAPPVSLTVLVSSVTPGGDVRGTLDVAIGGKATFPIPITAAAGAQFSTTVFGTSFRLGLRVINSDNGTVLGAFGANGWIYIPPCWRPRGQLEV